MSEGAASRADAGLPDVLEGSPADEWVRSLQRGGSADEAGERVREILARVREGGDAALLELSERFDGARPRSLRVSADECRRALEAASPERRAALERAARNVRRFHEAQRRREPRVEVEPGVTAWREFRPVARAGAYVPGGAAPYPSSLLMTVIPARVAGCAEVIVCSPPAEDGRPAPAVMAAAALAGADGLFAVGGAQAVAAMAYGTESVPRVDKLFGPGGAWVEAAKAAVRGDVAVDLRAGPSEVLVWADGAASPELAALELLAQAEHGPDSLAVAVLPSRELAAAVRRELAGRLQELPRAEAAGRSLARSALLVADAPGRAAAWIDEVAPEHLVLLREDARERAAEVASAGSVFLGPSSPVAAGDYAAGTNHVLPTGRAARAEDGLSVDDYGRWVQFQELSPEGLRTLGPTVVELAEWEGFAAHADSVRARLGGADTDEAPGRDTEGDGPERARPSVRRLVRPHLREVEPYRTARFDARGGILLDANESPFGPMDPAADPDLNRYPDPRTPELREALAAYLDVPEDALWIGNGSDDAIDVLLRTAVEPGERVALPVPTYGVYRIRARTHGAEVAKFPLDGDFGLDVDAALDAARSAKFLFLCSPNNPTGGLVGPEEVLALADATDALVAVDEAYVEFAGAPGLAAEAPGRPNLAVIRTFSKAWGLAGARVGYAVADPELARYLDLAALPYPLSAPAARAARRALEREEEMERRVRRVRRERERIRRGLEGMGLRVLPSDANFLLFFVEGSREARRRLAEEHGVVIRDRSGLPGLEGGLRVTVGAPEENDHFLSALERTLEERR